MNSQDTRDLGIVVSLLVAIAALLIAAHRVDLQVAEPTCLPCCVQAQETTD